MNDTIDAEVTTPDAAGTELRTLNEQVATMAEEPLAERGFAGGADFWLRNGGSVNVGDESHVFGLIRYWRNNRSADVNLSGTRQRMAVGDTVTVSDADCTIVYKQAMPRADGLIVFDISSG